MGEQQTVPKFRVVTEPVKPDISVLLIRGLDHGEAVFEVEGSEWFDEPAAFKRKAGLYIRHYGYKMMLFDSDYKPFLYDSVMDVQLRREDRGIVRVLCPICDPKGNLDHELIRGNLAELLGLAQRYNFRSILVPCSPQKQTERVIIQLLQGEKSGSLIEQMANRFYFVRTA